MPAWSSRHPRSRTRTRTCPCGTRRAASSDSCTPPHSRGPSIPASTHRVLQRTNRGRSSPAGKLRPPGRNRGQRNRGRRHNAQMTRRTRHAQSSCGGTARRPYCTTSLQSRGDNCMLRPHSVRGLCARTRPASANRGSKANRESIASWGNAARVDASEQSHARTLAHASRARERGRERERGRREKGGRAHQSSCLGKWASQESNRHDQSQRRKSTCH